jgi:membrane protease subunit HflK
VIPGAKGTASRLKEQAEGYRAKVVGEAEGDAQRFSLVLAEYQKAPGVTRDRLYVDAMRQVYSSVTKVMVDTKGNSNLLYLPLDKLIAQSAATTVNPGGTSGTSAVPDPAPQGAGTGSLDSRSRDNARGRDREGR